MPTSYPINPTNFDGEKFRARYALNYLTRDFWLAQDPMGVPRIYLRDGIMLPDDPPIFDPPDPPQIVARLNALAAQNGPGPERVLLRALAQTTLDAINQIRAALEPPRQPITQQQFRTAIQDKINSGTAD